MSEFCDFEESQRRLDVCKTCESFVVEELGTRCLDCSGGCSISLLISHIEEVCPKEKW